MCSERAKFVGSALLGLLVALLDVASDAFLLPNYWNDGIHSVTYASCVFVILSVPVVIVQIFVTITCIRDNDQVGFKDKSAFLQLLETLVDSVPQLVLNITALSICGRSLTPVQIVSITFSCLAIAWRTFDIESDRSAPLSFRMVVIYAYVFVTKIAYTAGRVFVLAYFCFYLGWWIFVAFAIRWLLWVLVSRLLFLQTSTKEMVFSVFVHTLGFGAVPPDGPIVLLIPIWTAVENMIFAVSTFEYGQSAAFVERLPPYAGLRLEDLDSFSHIPLINPPPIQGRGNGTFYPDFCLYNHPLGLHISLNVFVMMLVVGQFFLPIKRKDSPWSETSILFRNTD